MTTNEELLDKLDSAYAEPDEWGEEMLDRQKQLALIQQFREEIGQETRGEMVEELKVIRRGVEQLQHSSGQKVWNPMTYRYEDVPRPSAY
jgi:hypothetical protein